MSRRKHKTGATLKKAWRTRMAKIQAIVPRNFKQFAAQCQQTSVMYLNREVYGRSSRNTRTGHLKKRERLEMPKPTSGMLINDARTEEGFVYAKAVHGGRAAITTPTKRGKRVLAWVTGGATARPTSPAGWKAARQAGKVVLARKVRAVDPRPWRDRMVATMRVKLSKMLSQEIMEMVRRS